MTDSPLGSFLLPEPFQRPPLRAMAQERTVVRELARYAVKHAADPRHHLKLAGRSRSRRHVTDPVLLIPGFMAGDGTLALMSSTLRDRGFRTYRAHIRSNIGCTLEAATRLERRLEDIAERRDSRVQIVGHSLGGMIARGLAVRRPDLVSGIVTMGSPMLAPGAHHAALSWSVDLLVRLSRAGLSGLMAADCVAGLCARQSFEESKLPLSPDVAFTAIYSRRDGVVDWRACVDPIADPVEVRTSHCGMAFDPHVIDEVTAALRRHAAASSTPHIRIA